MDSPTDIARANVPDGWEVIAVDPPSYDPTEAERGSGLCVANTCGNYGTNWGCPPGWTRKIDSLLEEYDSAILLERTFGCHVSDRASIETANGNLHRSVRAVVSALRTSGYASMGMAGGCCGYCGVCSYPEPCRFPEMLVPSISAVGFDLGNYLGRLGRTVEFREDRVTLYGLVLYRSL